MWHELFTLHPSVAEKVMRAVLVYGFLVVALRLGGKREVGQLSTIDFIVLLAVANAVQNGIIGNDNSVTGAVVGATTLFLVNGLLVVLIIRSRNARRLLVGTPSVLVADGRVVEANLRHERMSRDELLQAVMEQGADDITDVEHCVIEPNGRIVVSLKNVDPNAGRYEMILERLSALEDHLKK